MDRIVKVQVENCYWPFLVEDCGGAPRLPILEHGILRGDQELPPIRFAVDAYARIWLTEHGRKENALTLRDAREALDQINAYSIIAALRVFERLPEAEREFLQYE